jgi:hypothetical protein
LDLSTVSNTSCILSAQDFDGNLFWSLSGSSTGSSSFAQSILFTPIGGSTHTVTLQCTIPANQSGNISHLMSYRLISTP